MSDKIKNKPCNLRLFKTLITTAIIGITISVLNIIPSVAQTKQKSPLKLVQDHSQMHQHNGQDLDKIHKILTQMRESMAQMNSDQVQNITSEQKQEMKRHYEDMIKEMQ
ncbi:MAG: hypothetical protein F6K18_30260 [Okeania sp. SIO2C2]|uniref:hypothetical protein n=1 Tax=Okeania sp. SIO2C2 TaxID=2607787 RepID=UPI0013B61DBC|nr:hypothetical protein [Okeania sp. SIO2C2]NEP90751.1 hypothetical protein [Okeania sp. SIO2C2]